MTGLYAPIVSTKFTNLQPYPYLYHDHDATPSRTHPRRLTFTTHAARPNRHQIIIIVYITFNYNIRTYLPILSYNHAVSSPRPTPTNYPSAENLISAVLPVPTEVQPDR
jgi:hypothetical protein